MQLANLRKMGIERLFPVQTEIVPRGMLPPSSVRLFLVDSIFALRYKCAGSACHLLYEQCSYVMRNMHPYPFDRSWWTNRYAIALQLWPRRNKW